MTQLPRLVVEVDFVNEPFNPAVTDPIWTDISDRVVTMDLRSSGRSYELDETEGAECVLWVRNHDGAFQPGNPASPYYPGVVPLRRIRVRAQWQGTLYPLFAGFVDEWPREWSRESGGVAGTVRLVCVDAMAVLAGAESLVSAYAEEVLVDAPIAYYPLGEPEGTASFGSIATTPQPPATIVDSKYGAGVVTAGADPVAPAEPSTALTFSGGESQATSDPGSALQLSALGQGPYISGTDAFSVEWWMRMTDQGTGTLGRIIAQFERDFPGGAAWNIYSADGDPWIFVDGDELVPLSGVHYDDGEPHHFVLAFEPDGVSWHWYIDGAEVDTGMLGAPVVFDTSGWVQLAGEVTSLHHRLFLNAAFAHVALYDHELTADRVAAHYQAGLTAHAGDLTGERVARILTWAGWAGGTDIDPGSSTLSGASTIPGANPLSACQEVAAWEYGAFVTDPDGKLAFRGRTARYNQEPEAVFGNRGKLGEIPFTDWRPSLDRQRIVNLAVFSRIGGGKHAVSDDDSRRRYFTNKLSREVGYDDDEQAIDAATYIVNRNADPHPRLERITCRPYKHPANWSAVLALRFGSCVDVVHRPPDPQPEEMYRGFVEQISHRTGPGDWVTDVILSPADEDRYWQIGVPGFSELDFTARLSF